MEEEKQEPGSVFCTLFSNSSEALKAVRDDYLYWTGKLTESSFSLAVAVIAANWAVFGTVADVMNNVWAKASISAVLVGLGVNLLGAKIMGEMHCARIEYAEKDPARWHEEFEKTHGKTDPWPFTKSINIFARFLRECKTWLPLIGGLLFLIALL